MAAVTVGAERKLEVEAVASPLAWVLHLLQEAYVLTTELSLQPLLL